MPASSYIGHYFPIVLAKFSLIWAVSGQQFSSPLRVPNFTPLRLYITLLSLSALKVYSDETLEKMNQHYAIKGTLHIVGIRLLTFMTIKYHQLNCEEKRLVIYILAISPKFQSNSQKQVKPANPQARAKLSWYVGSYQDLGFIFGMSQKS